MEQAPLISIIMPVYNAGVLLHTAVESVLRQSFTDFELLLVDDGSTDGSAALAHELAKKDGRIRVLEQPNAGICAARNLGLQHCRGQWFTFCDDDDTMLPHALETLLVLAKSTGAELADVPLFNVLSVLEGKVLNDAGDRVDTISGKVTIALPQNRE